MFYKYKIGDELVYYNTDEGRASLVRILKRGFFRRPLERMFHKYYIGSILANLKLTQQQDTASALCIDKNRGNNIGTEMHHMREKYLHQMNMSLISLEELLK